MQADPGQNSLVESIKSELRRDRELFEMSTNRFQNIKPRLQSTQQNGLAGTIDRSYFSYSRAQISMHEDPAAFEGLADKLGELIIRGRVGAIQAAARSPAISEIFVYTVNAAGRIASQNSRLNPETVAELDTTTNTYRRGNIAWKRDKVLLDAMGEHYASSKSTYDGGFLALRVMDTFGLRVSNQVISMKRHADLTPEQLAAYEQEWMNPKNDPEKALKEIEYLIRTRGPHPDLIKIRDALLRQLGRTSRPTRRWSCKYNQYRRAEHHNAFSGTIDIATDARDDLDTIERDSHTDIGDVLHQTDPSGEGVRGEETTETLLFGIPKQTEESQSTTVRLGSTRITARSIVVTIPKHKLSEIQAEEADVARRQSSGERGINYYWEMGRLPAEVPSRIYFVWDGAVRAYHEVTGIDRAAGRLYMDTTIHSMPAPMPMQGFRGFRYMRDEPHGKYKQSMHQSMRYGQVTDTYQNLNALDSDNAVPRSPLTMNPSESYHDDNFAEDKDLHLEGTTVGDEASSMSPNVSTDWQYAPEQEHSPVTMYDVTHRDTNDLESETRSPFVRVFRRQITRRYRS